MNSRYMAIDKDVDFHKIQSDAWLEKGIASIRVDSMDEAIEHAKNERFCFIAINADNIEYLPKLELLRATTTSHILVATSNFSGEEFIKAISKGADAFGLIDSNPTINADIVKAIIEKTTMETTEIETILHGSMLIMPELNRVIIGNRGVLLSKTEISVLVLLIKNKRKKVLSCQQIHESVCGKITKSDPEEFTRSVIKMIRRKLGSKDVIECVRNFGYLIGNWEL